MIRVCELHAIYWPPSWVRWSALRARPITCRATRFSARTTSAPRASARIRSAHARFDTSWGVATRNIASLAPGRTAISALRVGPHQRRAPIHSSPSPIGAAAFSRSSVATWTRYRSFRMRRVT